MIGTAGSADSFFRALPPIKIKKAEGNDITIRCIPYKEGVIACLLRQRVIDPSTGKEVEHNIGLHEAERVQALLKEPQSAASLDSGHPAWGAIKVWGTATRASL